ncbi:MAG: redoxin domain-containing protein [Bythopirellula sp.]|nr:redoxin domain-containing protein [Bythopirellula sp.]
MKYIWAALLSLLGSADLFAAESTIADFALQDYLGAEHKLSDWQDKELVVVAFLGTECPLAKLYGSRLADMAKEYAADGVQFVGINSNQQDTLREMAHYATQHKIEFPLLKDSAHKVADQFAAERTPTVYVLDQDRTIRYSGRIDDQFGVGYHRNEVKKNELVNALEDLLAGKPVSEPQTEAVGCIIGRTEKKAPTGDITYAQHISRLMQQHCVRCHREGQVAPFALTSYEETSAWAETMLEVIDDGRMPPWHANPEFGHFANDARMSDQDKQIFRQWVDNGMPEGDPSKLPPPQQFTVGWQIPQPDKIYKMDKPFTVPPKGTVDYFYVVIDPGIAEDTWVSAAEVRPSNYEVVHHAIAFFIPPHRDFKGGDPLRNSISTYAPGMPPAQWPEGYARFIPKGAKLVFQLHYTPNGSVQTDQTEVGLVYADPATVKKEIHYEIAVNPRFSIPPGEANHHVPARYEFDDDLMLHALIPHMHLRGKAFRFTANYPDGKKEVLLDVPRYDFNWQNGYVLSDIKRIPAGTIMECDAYYDNSADNLVNPDPTKEIHWGDQSWDEMMIGSMVVTEPDVEQEARAENSQTR